MDSWCIVYLAGLVLGSLVRVIYARGRRGRPALRQKAGGLGCGVLMAAWGLTQLAAVVYCLTDWLAWADYPLPSLLRWLGAAVYIGAIGLLWRSHVDLGSAWSPYVQAREGQTLVTTGVYRYVRHPMYAAHLLWGLGQALMLGNVLAGPAAIVVMILFCWARIGPEEKMMIEAFGADYRQYMYRTGRLAPRPSAWLGSSRK